MTRYDAFSRRELRRLRKEWTRRNRGPVVGIALMVVAVVAVSTLAMTWGSPTAGTYYVLGAIHATVVAAVLHLLNATFLATDRLAIGHVRGAWGEENTRDVLKRARKKQLVWDWVDSIDLARGDLDHVVITRHGGLVVADSKWRSQVDRTSIEDMARSAQKARTRAEGLARTLLARERGKRRARITPVAVTPVIVLWGAAQHEVPGGHQVRHGVHFVAGQQLLPWLRTLDHDQVDKAAARDLARRLKRYRASTTHVA